MRKEEKGSVQVQPGDYYFQEGRYCEALSAYTNELQIHPYDPVLLSKKGNTLYQLQQYEAADLSYAEALHHSNAVILVYEYVVEHVHALEANLWWLQAALSTQYHLDIIPEGLMQIVYHVAHEVLDQMNQSTTTASHSLSWKPCLGLILKLLKIPAAKTLLDVAQLLQPQASPLSIGLLQKKPVTKLTWQQFELFLKWFFEQQGYTVHMMAKSHDQGADLLLERSGERIVVQAKKRKKTTGNKAVQEVHAARGYCGANRAIVITATRFSNPAADLAARLGVELWDWNSLIEKINSPR